MSINKGKVIGITLIVICMYILITGVSILWGGEVLGSMLLTLGFGILAGGIGCGMYLCIKAGEGKENERT